MNRQEQQRTVAEWTALPYTPPRCSVIPYESEGFICATIRHRAENSTEEEWEEDEEITPDENDIRSGRLDWY